jgi:hypothetical protein
MMFFSFAAAANVHYKNIQNGYEFESPTSFTLKLPKEITEINLDGYPMSPFRDNEYTIPAGTHNVTLTTEAVTSFSTHELKAKILSFTGNLLSASYGMKDIKFSYESETRTLITINREPTSVKIDDKDYNFSVMKGNDCFTIFLPPGHHAVELNAGDSFTYGISLTSLWSSTGIAIFGTLAVGLLVFMYISLKFVRKKYSTA